MKTKMHFDIPTTFKTIDAFLGSVNRVDLPRRTGYTRMASFGTDGRHILLIRHQRNHFFLIEGKLQDIHGITAGGFNCYLGFVMELYARMYPRRHLNAVAFMRWHREAEAQRHREGNLKNLKDSAREFGYTLVKQ